MLYAAAVLLILALVGGGLYFLAGWALAKTVVFILATAAVAALLNGVFRRHP